jgi:hypothetical protein
MCAELTHATARSTRARTNPTKTHAHTRARMPDHRNTRACVQDRIARSPTHLAAGCELGVSRREADTSYPLFVGLVLSNLVHVGLPVHDLPVVVARYHPVGVVRPHHVPHTRLVRLENSFKVEREAVPQCKLSRRRTGDQPSTLWCPLERKDRTLDLSECSWVCVIARVRWLLGS